MEHWLKPSNSISSKGTKVFAVHTEAYVCYKFESEAKLMTWLLELMLFLVAVNYRNKWKYFIRLLNKYILT